MGERDGLFGIQAGTFELWKMAEEVMGEKIGVGDLVLRNGREGRVEAEHEVNLAGRVRRVLHVRMLEGDSLMESFADEFRLIGAHPRAAGQEGEEFLTVLGEQQGHSGPYATCARCHPVQATVATAARFMNDTIKKAFPALQCNAGLLTFPNRDVRCAAPKVHDGLCRDQPENRAALAGASSVQVDPKLPSNSISIGGVTVTAVGPDSATRDEYKRLMEEAALFGSAAMYVGWDLGAAQHSPAGPCEACVWSYCRVRREAEATSVHCDACGEHRAPLNSAEDFIGGGCFDYPIKADVDREAEHPDSPVEENRLCPACARKVAEFIVHLRETHGGRR